MTERMEQGVLNDEQIRGIIGGTAVDQNGDKIGKVGMVYLDDRTGEPDWATVNTGLFGTSESFVPLRGATVDGDTLRVPYTKDQVKDAPSVDADRHLDEEDERRLYQHYGMDYESTYTGTTTGTTTTEAPGTAAAGTAGTAGTAAGTSGVSDRGTVGHDTSGPETDNAMTRSEEQLRVDKQQRETGRARLRKYVTTEQESVTVPVRREEVRVEREPVTEENRDRATSGPAISEEEHEVVLHEERPVAEKEATPVERVRLDKDTVTDDERVTEDVRKEHIEAEGADVRGDRADTERR